MKKEVQTTKSGYPLMRYLSLLLVVALLFSGVTFARFALERRGSIDTGVALFDASYTVEGVNSLTFGNSYYWKDEGNRWYEQGSARTVRIQMKNNSDVNVRANVLHMEGPAEFWENIALQLLTVKENDPAGVAADQIITTQYVLADLLRVRTGGKNSNGNDPIYDADGNKATHQYGYGDYIAWSPSSTENEAVGGKFNTGFSDEFGQRGNVEESLQMSGGITAEGLEQIDTTSGEKTYDLSKVTDFSGTVTAVRKSSTGTTDLTTTPLTITITASMKTVQYSVGFARRQEQRSLPAFYLDCGKAVPYYEIDITLPDTTYFDMENGETTSVIAFLTWTNSLQSTDLTTNVYKGLTDEGLTDELNWEDLTDGTETFNSADSGRLNWKVLTDGTQQFNSAEVVGYHFNYNDVPATQNKQSIETTVRMNKTVKKWDEESKTWKKLDTPTIAWEHVASISSEDGVYAHPLELLELQTGNIYQCSGKNPVKIAEEAVEACGGTYGTHFQENDFLWSEDDDASTPDFCLASEKGYQVTFSVSFVQSSELP